MYLSNLKIHGFKSFANKTLLDFNGGLTCIVGPNGCGKSNIVDAVRWVLGEQRSGILRSEKMENVIFSGSKAAKPLGMAEVSMTIQNNRNVLPIEYSEVMVTRRLYRSGESEYLLNKTPCRLKDIRDLFIDTGVGPDTYSVIELKMVESILSSKSDERLGLFEEAAGINKYKQRRNAAFRKLDATNGDLNRVVDILSEVERNVNSLKRQVGRAERFQALNHEIEELEIREASLEYFVLQKKLKPLKNDLTNLERNYQQNRSVLSRDEADLEKNRVMLMTMEDSLAQFQRNLSQQTEVIHRNENKIIVTQERFKATEEKIQRYTAEQEQLKKRVEILQQRIKENEPNLGMLGEKVDALRMKYRLKEQELTEFEKALARRRLDANEAQTQLIQLLETISEQEKERNLLESRLIHQEGRIDQLKKEISRLLEARQKTSREEDQLAEYEKKLERQYLQAEERLQIQQERVRKLQTGTEESREKFAVLKNKLTTLQQQKSFFNNLIELNKGFPDGVQFILKASKTQPGVLGLLADLITVPKKYRLAVEAILGEKAFYVVVKSEADAFGLIEQLKQEKLGQVTFLILDRVGTAAPPPARELPNVSGVLSRATEVIQTGAQLRPVIQTLFHPYLFVTDATVLKTLAKTGKWHAASLTGEVSAADGLLRSGRYESGEKVSAVSRSAQLEEIIAEIQKISREANDAEKAMQKILTERKNAEKETANLMADVKKAREAFQQVRIQAAQQKATVTNLTDNLVNSRTELEKIERLVLQTRERLQLMKPELDSLVRKRRRYEDETEIQQEKLEELEVQRNQLAEEAHHLNVDLVQSTGEKNTLEADLKRMRRTLQDYENTIVQREEELKEAHRDIVTFKQEIKSIRAELEQLRHKKDTLLSGYNEKKQEHQQLQEQIKRKEAVLKQARREGESSVDLLQNLRVEVSETEMKIQNLQKNIREKYAVDITPIRAGMPDELENINLKLEKFRERLRTFGAVNLLALDEYKKESERMEFLYRQKNDLVEARDTLLETIQVINRSAHEQFEEVFNQIRDNFRRNFEQFFEGGEGDLRIHFDPEDPLAANIIILARPRGKQLGALELLSAGEKALTAITLLFSIYQVKPSPFCILDEVDAPLDDINVRRFLRILDTFSEHTQFIIVSHNKITMEAADYIYGVTMAQEGISKIVSVELQKADEFISS